MLYLWNQVRQHRTTLYCHDLLQAIQSKLSRFLIILQKHVRYEIQTRLQSFLNPTDFILHFPPHSLTSCLSRVGRMSSSAW